MGCDKQLVSQTSSTSTDSPTESNVENAFFRSLGRLVSLSSESQVDDVFVQSSPDKVGQIRFEKWHNRLTDVSAEILSLGQRLEHFYPLLYDHLAAQLKMPLKSEIAITKAMTCIGDYMFRNNYVTWYRIVAMFAIAGAMSIEAVENHRGSLITSIVHVFSQIIERHAALWICKQGGWVSLIQEYEPTNESYRLLATVFGIIVGIFIIWIMPFRFFCPENPFI